MPSVSLSTYALESLLQKLDGVGALGHHDFEETLVEIEVGNADLEPDAKIQAVDSFTEYASKGKIVRAGTVSMNILGTGFALANFSTIVQNLFVLSDILRNGQN